MRKYLFIAIGGALGAMLRVAVKGVDLHEIMGKIPVNTLLINLSGSFLLAFILTFAYTRFELNPDIRLGVTVGFLGAFTTFSAMCKEITSFICAGHLLLAIIYTLLSIIFGLLCAWLGILLGEKLTGKRCADKEERDSSEESECTVCCGGIDEE